MDASDKIIVLHSLDELKEAIIADTTSQDVLAQRYCVRFIMLNNFEAFREVYKFLVKELNVELLDIENLAKGEDKTITVDTLSDAVKGITKSTLVTPFSELVRFYNVEKFNGFFNEIIFHCLKHIILFVEKNLYICEIPLGFILVHIIASRTSLKVSDGLKKVHPFGSITHQRTIKSWSMFPGLNTLLSRRN